ncbi:NAD(P)H-hydrate dehydratase [Roseateles terrae]|uniref:Bifunctional NAD(P)H-hydrate repair enzyme n=1 Tax=Roseateles terrae TaxID=431060 RepID=A0ABR6GWD3_9BURK|nr:NAD(P)H-hydrate dehydratase [Roseateles terrae]MBB3196360.1 hydroxyethylthiazole kinase-like uncharacterized protein yjeF [Roseateles terrae]OWQ83897.1 NAD(P)H-hydrate dehydratase [Roseateles terrae]
MRALLPPQEASWPVHDIAASRALEQDALRQRPAHQLIEQAGAAVARLALALVPHGRHAVVLAGPGNNGGDALIAARWLAARGWTLQIYRIGSAPPEGSDAAHALQSALDAGLTVHAGPPPAVTRARPASGLPSKQDTAPAKEGTSESSPTSSAAAAFNTTSAVTLASASTPIDLWIDGLLGLGAHRPPEGDIATAIRIANAHPAPTLSIDLPSGLHGDTGQACGDDTIRADHTLTLLTLKPGLLTGEGRAYAGRIWFDDLGVASADASGPTTPHPTAPTDRADHSPASAAARLAARFIGLDALTHWHRAHPRGTTSHKGRQGDVAVLGGAPGMRGAAWLAATAALSAGAGRVYAALPEDDGQPWPARPELMHWPKDRWHEPHAWREPVVVAGCGGGTALLPWLDAVLHDARHLVLDADGLNLVAQDEGLSRRLAARRSHGLQTVLTPHPLEASRLLGLSGVAAVQADRLASARALAEKFDCTVVLKGSGSVIASPGHLPDINSTGSAALATAGTGDVLAGWTGGLWAQARDADPHEVARTAVLWHGAAAQHHKGPLRAGDLIEAMAALHRD